MNRRIGAIGAFALGIALLMAPTAQAAGAPTIHVPGDFDPSLSDTRATGHYEVEGSALHIWTEGANKTDKVAEYVDTDVSLSSLQGEPALQYDTNSGSIPPGYQLVVDFDANGTNDGILVGEPTKYGSEWWLASVTDPSVPAGAPHTGGGSGSAWYGTLAEWNTAFPHAVVSAFGFSLGSGVQGDYTVTSIDFDGTTYTFAADVVLTSKDECKNGGWATSAPQTFRNQGDCVSYFASSGNNRKN